MPVDNVTMAMSELQVPVRRRRFKDDGRGDTLRCFFELLVVRGRKITGFIAIADDLKNAGAEYLEQDVVVDGNLITSRTPDDLPAFCRAVIGALKEI